MSDETMLGTDVPRRARRPTVSPSRGLRVGRQRWLLVVVVACLLVVVVGLLDPPWWQRLSAELRLHADRLAASAEAWLRHVCGVPVGFPS